jgi:hypothetical protein
MKNLLLILIISLTIPFYAFTPIGQYSYVSPFSKEQQKQIEKEKYIHVIIATFSHQESRGNYNAIGGSGDLGKYQILPTTWKNWSKMYFGKQLIMSPENQDLMIETVITDWVDKGLTVAQIAAKWNSGSHVGWQKKIGINKFGVPYNVPQYVNNFVNHYNKIKGNS